MSQLETNEYLQLIQKCDSLLSEGKIASVGPLISSLNFARVPRPYRTALAKICRRAGLITQGLRLLHPILHAEKPKDEPATGAEICEYSVLLSRNGSINEALELLEEVDATALPEALLYQGFCNVSRWDYGVAKDYFLRFLDSKAGDYEKLIARVNLIAAAISTDDWKLAEPLVEQTIEIATRANALRLLGNCFELRAQIYVLNDRFEEAQTDLDRSLEIFKGGSSYDNLFVTKWKSIIRSRRELSTEPLAAFRTEAMSRKHWESVREADFFSLKVRFEQGAFDHLSFGTPHVAYKRRIEAQLGQSPSAIYQLGDPSPLSLDLQTGRLGDREGINPGKMIHQVLTALAKDFYAPRSPGALFAELYRGEYFDVNTSPLRLRQVLSRTRAWLKDHDLPASIEQLDGGYRLVIGEGMNLRIPNTRDELPTSNLVLWDQLQKQFTDSFNASEASTKLAISRSSFHRFAEWAIENGKLQKTGVGKATVYHVGALKKVG